MRFDQLMKSQLLQPDPLIATTSTCRLSRRAFTLIELMISIALALLLILGVNLVFRTASHTLKVGQHVAQINRNEQSLQTLLTDDVNNLVLPEDAPFLFIRSQREAGFLNAADQDSDTDYNASQTNRDTVDDQIRSYDRDGDGVEDFVSPALYTRRNHRLDTIGFFTRKHTARQTGADDLVDDMQSAEAYVWYGHLKQPNFNEPLPGLPRFNHHAPGIDYRTAMAASVDPLTAATNPENFYVDQWTLGRVQMALMRPDGNMIYSRGGTSVTNGFIKRIPGELDSTSAAPLTVNSRQNPDYPNTNNNSGAFDGWLLQWSRYDAAATTMQQYRRILANFSEDGTNTNWYFPISNFRHQYSSLLSQPLTPEEAARSVPGLAHGISHFMVEFAGDFISQDNNGNTTAVGPDGVLDFIVYTVGAETCTATRWYGMPRDGNGDGRILIHDNTSPLDVVPVAGVIATFSPSFSDPGFFERVGPARPGSGDYIDTVNNSTYYLAAWGPDSSHWPKPQYLRFVIGSAPADVGGDEHLAEYVFSLK